MREPIKGYIMTCDRCGKKDFVKGIPENGGWVQVFKEDICPDCAKELNTFMSKFLGRDITADDYTPW